MQNQLSKPIEISPKNSSPAGEYFAGLFNCPGEKSIGDLNPDKVIESLCESSTHHRSGQPLSEDRLRHILEHTREFLEWASDRHPALLKGFGYFEMRHWQQIATEANRAWYFVCFAITLFARATTPCLKSLVVGIADNDTRQDIRHQ